MVVPCFNEEAVLPILRQRIPPFLDRLQIPVEVVFVDDGSRDATLALLQEWACQDPRIKVIGLARNFGHQNAATAGLDAASGDAVVLIDADLQDPLEVIPLMVAKYCEGYDVVYGQRIAREGETPFKLFTAWFFYRLMKLMILPSLPPDTGDFRLISRRCLDALLSMREVHRFLRGMVTWVGFNQIPVQYQRDPRAGGSTKYPIRKMVAFAWNAIISFSPLPLRISLLTGFFVAVIGLLYGAYAVYRAIVYKDTVHGWTTEIVLTSLLGGAMLISNGILGEYVGRCFEELKHRPLYIVANRFNLPEKNTPQP